MTLEEAVNNIKKTMYKTFLEPLEPLLIPIIQYLNEQLT